MQKFFILISLTVCFLAKNDIQAQEFGETMINGEIVTYIVEECGDTLLIADLEDVSITSPRRFKNRADYLKYRKYRRYAVKVYPYAVEAIKIFREVDYATQTMSKSKRKKHVKKLQKELEKEFEIPLKKLTKTQGKILVKMIEKELETPMHQLIKNLRGGFTATYWSTFASFYGHKLKRGYILGDDPILDMVLSDMNISYELAKE